MFLSTMLKTMWQTNKPGTDALQRPYNISLILGFIEWSRDEFRLKCDVTACSRRVLDSAVFFQVIHSM